TTWWRSTGQGSSTRCSAASLSLSYNNLFRIPIRNPHGRPASATPGTLVLDPEDLRQGSFAGEPRRSAIVLRTGIAPGRGRLAHARRADRAERVRVRTDGHRNRQER